MDRALAQQGYNHPCAYTYRELLLQKEKTLTFYSSPLDVPFTSKRYTY